MMPLAQAVRLWHGLRTNGLPATFRGVMRRLGVRVAQYYWVREGSPGQAKVRVAALPEGLEFSVFGVDRISAIPKLDAPQHEVDQGRLMEGFERGDTCVGITRGDEIMAYSWWALDATHSQLYPVAMESNEAYLHNMYVRPDSRGHDLAGILRSRCYELLRALGRDTCYSISITNNKASLRFKEKLGGRKLFRGVYIKCGRHEWRPIVRRYPG